MPGVEAVEADTPHAFPRHTHEQFGIGVILRGAQRSASGRGPVEAGAGDVITVNPGEVHDGAPIGGASRAWRMLYFDPSLVADAVADRTEGRRASSEFPRPVVTGGGSVDRFLRLFRAMTTEERDTAGTLREEALLLLLAAVASERGEIAEERRVPEGIRIARSLVDDDPSAPVSLSDLARESGLSRFQVLRGFARETGLTPHAYLVQRRIAMARRLIARGTPLAQAAAACGFSDQSHMTRVFVRMYGVSPGAYAEAVG